MFLGSMCLVYSGPYAVMYLFPLPLISSCVYLVCVFSFIRHLVSKFRVFHAYFLVSSQFKFLFSVV